MKQLRQFFSKFPWIVYILRGILCLVILVLVANTGINMLLDVVFNGPSEAARDALTLTLLESEDFKHIPGKFLDEATILQISGAANAPAGLQKPGLVQPGSSIPSSSETIALSNCTATVTLVSGTDRITLTPGGEGQNHIRFENGVLCIVPGTGDGTACGSVLVLNGAANEALYNSVSGYGARCAIGQMADGTVILVTTDGGSREVPGATYQNMIDIMVEYGAVNACLLAPGSATASED